MLDVTCDFSQSVMIDFQFNFKGGFNFPRAIGGSYQNQLRRNTSCVHHK